MSPSSNEISIIILAGGQSKRMGQDKALVSWQDSPLLTRVSQTAQDISPHIFVLSPWPHRYQQILPRGIQLLKEHQPGEGPLSALAQSLTHISFAWVLLLACDMPQLDSRVLNEWRSHLKDLPKDCLAYVPQINSRWEPLCGFYRHTSLTSLNTFLDLGGRSFQKWLNSINAITIPVQAEHHAMFHNCNRPEDLTSF